MRAHYTVAILAIVAALALLADAVRVPAALHQTNGSVVLQLDEDASSSETGPLIALDLLNLILMRGPAPDVGDIGSPDSGPGAVLGGLTLLRANLNPLSNTARVRAIQAIYPRATRAFVYIRPCFVDHTGDQDIARIAREHGAILYYAYTDSDLTQGQTAAWLDILSSRVPATRIDDRTLFYELADDARILVYRRGPGPAAAAPASRVLVDMDLSSNSLLWSEGGYRGYILTDRALVLLGPSYDVSNMGVYIDRRYSATHWYIERLWNMTVNGQTGCSHVDNLVTFCLDPSQSRDELPLELAVDAETHAVNAEIDVSEAIYAHAAAASPLLHSRSGYRFRMARSRTQINATRITWGAASFARHVRALSFVAGTSQLTVHISPTDSITPAIGWPRAVFLAIAAVLFARRNLTPGIELRWGIRALLMQSPSAFSKPYYNLLPAGDLFADVLLCILAFGSYITYIVAAAVLEFDIPSYASYAIFSAYALAATVLFTALLGHSISRLYVANNRSWRRAGAAMISDTIISALWDPASPSSSSCCGRRGDSASRSADKEVVTGVRTSLYITLALRGLGDITTAAAIAALLWWNTDDAFDWGFLCGSIGVGLWLAIHQVIECGLLVFWDFTAAERRGTRRRGSDFRVWGAVLYAAFITSFVVLQSVYGVPQVIGAYLLTVAPADLNDHAVYWIIWTAIFAIPVAISAVQLTSTLRRELRRRKVLIEYVNNTLPTPR